MVATDTMVSIAVTVAIFMVMLFAIYLFIYSTYLLRCVYLFL